MHKYLHLSSVFGLFWNIQAPTNVCVKDIGSWVSMVLQNYQSFIEMTSNMIYNVAFDGGLKFPRFMHTFVANKMQQQKLSLSDFDSHRELKNGYSTIQAITNYENYKKCKLNVLLTLRFVFLEISA